MTEGVVLGGHSDREGREELSEHHLRGSTELRPSESPSVLTINEVGTVLG